MSVDREPKKVEICASDVNSLGFDPIRPFRVRWSGEDNLFLFKNLKVYLSILVKHQGPKS